MSGLEIEKEYAINALWQERLRIGLRLLEARKVQYWSDLSCLRATVEKRYRSNAVRQQIEEVKRDREVNELDLLVLKLSKARSKARAIRIRKRLGWANAIERAESSENDRVNDVYTPTDDYSFGGEVDSIITID